MGFASKIQQVPKIPVIVLRLDTIAFRENLTILIDSIKLTKLKSFLSDSTDGKKELGELEFEVFSLKQQSANIVRNITSSKILLFALAVLIIAMLVFLIRDKKERREEIIFTLTDVRQNPDGIHRLIAWKNKIVKEAAEQVKQNWTDPGPPPKYSELENTIIGLQERLAILEGVIKQKLIEVSSQVEEQSKDVPPIISSKTLYADAIINGMFNKVTEQPNDDTVYELFLKTPTDKYAALTIYRDAYRRVIKNADFIDGCEKQRINNNPNDLQIEKGEAHMQDTGKWQIAKKANIKFV